MELLSMGVSVCTHVYLDVSESLCVCVCTCV